MAKILITTTGLTGILNASFELANRLIKAGHTVTLAAPRPRKELVEATGFKFIELPTVPLQTVPPLPDEVKNLPRWHRVRYRWQARQQRKALALDTIRPYQFISVVENHQPDLLLLDVELHEYIFTAYGRGWQFLLLSQWYSLWDQPGLPYLLKDTIPGQGLAGSTWGLKISWWWIKLQRYWMFRRQAFLSLGTDRRSVLKALAKETSFPAQLIKQNFWPGPFTYARLPVLAMAPYEMEFPHQPRPNLHYVGPMVYAQRKEPAALSLSGNSLTEIIRQKQQQNAKLILFTISTMRKGEADFLSRVVKAVAHHKDWVMILGLGGETDPDIWQDIAPNIHPFTFVPQLRVLREAADLSINHGGIHTIHECLYFRVPMLVYSGKRSDQNGCAARVHYHGLGRMADKDLDTPEQIRQRIHEILSNEAYRQKISTFHQIAVEKYMDDQLLEKLVDEAISNAASGQKARKSEQL